MIKVKLSNSYDIESARRGLIPPEEVREVEIEALVDTGATMLVLPGPVVERLGVPVLRYNDVRYANGHSARVARVGNILFEVLGRNIVGVTPTTLSMGEAATIMSRLQAGVPWAGSFVVRNRAGEAIVADVLDIPVRDQEGVLIGIVGVSHRIAATR